MPLDDIDECIEIDRADIEIAIGREHDAIDAAVDERLLGHLIGKTNTARTVRAAAGLQPFQGTEDFCLLVTRVGSSTTPEEPA